MSEGKPELGHLPNLNKPLSYADKLQLLAAIERFDEGAKASLEKFEVAMSKANTAIIQLNAIRGLFEEIKKRLYAEVGS